MVSHQHALADLDKLELDDDTRELYLAGNAQRVFNLYQ
jgi:predicted TIM-barrel fold metal-dependent hydrolase